jgi:hypothetical protein
MADVRIETITAQVEDWKAIREVAASEDGDMMVSIMVGHLQQRGSETPHGWSSGIGLSREEIAQIAAAFPVSSEGHNG